MVDRSAWYSVFVMLRDAVRHWLLLISGAIASLVDWVLQARKELPTDYFVYVGAALMIVARARAWHELRVARDTLADDRNPKFEIVVTLPFLNTGKSDGALRQCRPSGICRRAIVLRPTTDQQTR